MSERISTGIPGLDEMLGGGLLSGRTYLIKGGPGMGKTTLSIQFLMAGVQRGEHVMYITLEEPLEMVKADMEVFGFDLGSPLFHGIDATPVGKKTHIFETVYYNEFAESFEKFMSAVEDRIKENNIRRVAIDPITMLRLTIRDDLEYRRIFIGLLKIFMRYDATALITSSVFNEVPEVEDYLSSGVIELRRYGVEGHTVRGIQILKMRGTSFDEDVRPYVFSERGIEVYASENLYTR